ncbi:MAG: TIGR04168 family protein [Leptolyngbyaceae cyanobacterium]
MEFHPIATDPAMSSPQSAYRIAIVGDVHDQWDPQDAIALQHLGVDLVLLVGDFGNESVDIVRQVAALDIPKAVILGNHDAWYTATPWGAKRCPYDRSLEDRIATQLDLLGPSHVGYGHLDIPELGLTVVGARPFSWGGPKWQNTDFYRKWFGVSNFAESIERMVESIEAAAHDTLLFIGHCGPKGLGDFPESICGKDWNPPGGDHGEPDFAAAISHAQDIGKNLPLVTFGHMHHGLRHRRDRERDRLTVDAKGTVYLNAAAVPRIIKTETTCQRNFSLVTLQGGKVKDATLTWIDQDLQVVREESLLNSQTQLVAQMG